MLCQVICNGQGPSVCFVPPSLNFGTVTLLNTVTKELEVINDTPIPATIEFSFVRLHTIMKSTITCCLFLEEAQQL
jgi:hypothetical protein